MVYLRRKSTTVVRVQGSIFFFDQTKLSSSYFTDELLAGKSSFSLWWVGLTKHLDSGGTWEWSTGEPLSDEIGIVDGKHSANTSVLLRWLLESKY